jgi:hypothetical protein
MIKMKDEVAREIEAREDAAEYLANAAAADTHSSDVDRGSICPKYSTFFGRITGVYPAVEKDAGSESEYGSRGGYAEADFPRGVKKPKVKLIGRNGNAFAILGACTKAARKSGWTPASIKLVMDEMTAGDYSHLLATAMRYFDVS